MENKFKRSFVLFLCIIVIVLSLFALNLTTSYAGPDGSGNNFFYKGPTAFAVLPANKFVTIQSFTYQTWGAVFNKNGIATNISNTENRYVFLSEYVWTHKLLGLTNFFEFLLPFGNATANATPSNPSYENSSSGIGDPLLYYGVYAYNYNSANFGFNIFPQISVTVPAGNWSNNSTVNLGGDEWQIQPALTGEFDFKTNLSFLKQVAMSYAVGFSKNEGHSSINMANLNNNGVSITDPGNNIFGDVFINFFILPNLDIYNETTGVRQYNNYGYKNAAEPEFQLLNSGYIDVATGAGIDYHIKNNIQLDFRVLRDIHGKNGPDGFYSEGDIIIAF